MQISYHFALTKIQKLQNLNIYIYFFCTDRYGLYMAGTAGLKS